MRTLTSTVYECALDGKRFLSDKECKDYEKKSKRKTKRVF